MGKETIQSKQQSFESVSFSKISETKKSPNIEHSVKTSKDDVEKSTFREIIVAPNITTKINSTSKLNEVKPSPLLNKSLSSAQDKKSSLKKNNMKPPIIILPPIDLSDAKNHFNSKPIISLDKSTDEIEVFKIESDKELRMLTENPSNNNNIPSNDKQKELFKKAKKMQEEIKNGERKFNKTTSLVNIEKKIEVKKKIVENKKLESSSSVSSSESTESESVSSYSDIKINKAVEIINSLANNKRLNINVDEIEIIRDAGDLKRKKQKEKNEKQQKEKEKNEKEQMEDDKKNHSEIKELLPKHVSSIVPEGLMVVKQECKDFPTNAVQYLLLLLLS
jgi:hypothetical protein